MTKNTEKSALIVDDSNFERILMRKVLENVGITKIYEAQNGQEGVRSARFYKPDIILLDLNMPGMNGFQACEKIRIFTDRITTPILVITGTDREETLNKIYALGANDYFEKPIDINIVGNRIKFYMDYCQRLRELHRLETSTRHDLEIATYVQEKSMPERESVAAQLKEQGYDFSSYYRPSESLGGDAWHIYYLDDGSPVLFLFDVTGHGINAAINISYILGLVETLFEKSKTSKDFSPHEFLTKLNAALCKHFENGMFCAGMCLHLDTEKHAVSYAVCALPDIYLRRKDATEVQKLNCSGLPMGINTDRFSPTTGNFNLNTGDMIVCTTDGLTESVSETAEDGDNIDNSETLQGERFLYKRLSTYCPSSEGTSLDICVNELISEYENNSFVLSDDDTTLFMLKRIK